MIKIHHSSTIIIEWWIHGYHFHISPMSSFIVSLHFMTSSSSIFFHKPPLFHVTLPHINLTLFSPFLSPQLPLFPQLTSSSNFHNVSLPFSSRFFSLSWACHPFFLLHVPFFHPSYSSHLFFFLSWVLFKFSSMKSTFSFKPHAYRVCYTMPTTSLSWHQIRVVIYELFTMSYGQRHGSQGFR